MTTDEGTATGGAGEAPGQARPEEVRLPAEPLAPWLNGAQWALALLLILQALFGVAFPTLTDLALARWLTRFGGACLGPCELTLTPILPWAVFAVIHLLQARLLRRRGAFPFADGQVAWLTLLPGYNLTGTVALFTAEGEALERLGAGRGLGRQLRLGAALASGLAVAQVVLVLQRLRPAIDLGWLEVREVILPGTELVWVAVALLVTRLFLLARLQLANHRLASAPGAGAPPAPLASSSRELAGLLDPRLAIAVVALAAAAAGLAIYPPARWTRSASGEGLRFTGDEPVRAPPLPKAAPAPAPAAATTTPTASATATPAPVAARPPPPPEPLYAGRTAAWWSDRLRLLQARADADGRRLYDLTRDRAEANGLAVEEGAGGLRAVPVPPVAGAQEARP